MSHDDTTAAPRRQGKGPLELVVLTGGQVQRLAIPPAGEVTIGRSVDAELVVDEPSLSRLHARVSGGTPPLIEDLGSANGTVLGGRRLAPGERAPLGRGVVIEVGDVTVLVRSLLAEDGMPATSDARELESMIEMVAPSDLSVLILGETGAGKEVVARRVHRESKRSDQPLVTINCAALPDTMVESELFGHERGAFTGAVASKVGLIESAHGGTVFLDEIAELPLASQAKLLRVLESGEVQRLGAVTPTSIDVRFIAATHRDLTAWVEAGTFREDLLFRLDGVTLAIPPLRSRIDELPKLAEQFIAEFCERDERPIVRLAPAALDKLAAHAWPGNVRELRKVIERGVVLCQGDVLQPGHLKLTRKRAAASVAPTAPLFEQVGAQRDQLERDAIVEALAACNGNQTRAAKRLGIARRTLIDRIERYGLPRPRKA